MCIQCYTLESRPAKLQKARYLKEIRVGQYQMGLDLINSSYNLCIRRNILNDFILLL